MRESVLMKPTLFTIGYERHRTPDSFVAALAAARVERLVDVRELPLSRRRFFSKTALSGLLTDAGIEYAHARPLGNPKPYRDLYRSGRQEEGAALYLAHLRNGSAAAVDELTKTLSGRRTCVLCFEDDHRTCHRAVLVDELRERLADLRVEHL
jgi:uncharacterized protein (DUF488 family)